MQLAVNRTTLDDVARDAGVHRSTVSLSLRNHPRIPVQTRDKVKAAADRLGYRSDPLVSALMQSRRNGRLGAHLTLAFVSDQQLGRMPSLYFAGAAARAADFGFRLERFSYSGSGFGRELSDRLSIRCIKGVLLDARAVASAAAALDWTRFSAVALGPPAAAGPKFHIVAEDAFRSVQVAMEQCRQRGYQRIGYIGSGPSGNGIEHERGVGAFVRYQQFWRPEARLPVYARDATTSEFFRSWYSQHRPDALLVDDPSTLMTWLRPLRLRAPHDIGIAALLPHHAPNCSGCYCDPAVVGALAVDMLIGLMHRKETGIPSAAHTVLVEGQWREHDTLPSKSK